MNDEWLAAWDAATEDDRRAVLAAVASRLAATSERHDYLVAPATFVIAARRDADALVVVTCSHYQTCLRDATEGIPVVESDYVYLQVELDEVRVTGGAVRGSEVLLSREVFYVEYAGTIGVDGDAGAREIAGEFLATYPALVRVRSTLSAECAARAKPGLSSIERWPEVRVLATVPDGERIAVTVVATYRVGYLASRRRNWSLQAISIREVVTEGDVVITETIRATEEIRIEATELLAFDQAAAERQLVATFLADCTDWRVVWAAASERAQLAARVHAGAKASADYRDACPAPDLGWRAPEPEVVGARRREPQLAVQFGWTYWVGGEVSLQTVTVFEVTVDEARVVRDRQLASTTIAITSPRDQHDPLAVYRERLGGVRDAAAAVAHVLARLEAICEASPGDVRVAPAVRVVRQIRSGHRWVVRTVGWYRLAARSIEVDDVTVENGQVVDRRSLRVTSGELAEEASATDGARLDADLVAEVVAWANQQP